MSFTHPGLCLYTVRHAMQKDIADTFQLLSAMGYRNVEMYGSPSLLDFERTSRAFLESELTPVAWQMDWDEIHANSALPELMNAYGCRTVVLPCLPVARRPLTKAQWLMRIDELNALALHLGQGGIRLGYHIAAHDFALCESDTSYYALLVQNLAPDALLEVDTGNCYQGGFDPAAAIRHCAGRPLYIHMKPYSPDKRFNVVLGEKEDASNWDAICESGAGRAEQWLIEGSCDSLQELQVACLSLDNWRRLAGRKQRP